MVLERIKPNGVETSVAIDNKETRHEADMVVVGMIALDRISNHVVQSAL